MTVTAEMLEKWGAESRAFAGRMRAIAAGIERWAARADYVRRAEVAEARASEYADRARAARLILNAARGA